MDPLFKFPLIWWKKNVDLIISVCVSHPYDLVILTAAMLKDCHMKVEILKMNSDQLGWNWPVISEEKISFNSLQPTRG